MELVFERKKIKFIYNYWAQVDYTRYKNKERVIINSSDLIQHYTLEQILGALTSFSRTLYSS